MHMLSYGGTRLRSKLGGRHQTTSEGLHESTLESVVGTPAYSYDRSDDFFILMVFSDAFDWGVSHDVTCLGTQYPRDKDWGYGC